MLSVADAAERLAVSEVTVRRWIRDGRLKAHQWQPNGAVRIDPDDLRREPPKMIWMSPT
jgi:excisionase family DNA binding protein